jgi:hypothetical protein
MNGNPSPFGGQRASLWPMTIQFKIAGRREEMNSSRFLLLLATAASVVVYGEAGFRCSIGEIVCKGSCVIQLKNSGESLLSVGVHG